LVLWMKEAVLARNTSVSLGDHFADFIDSQVNGGRYGSASDVVRAGLRLLEDQETKLEVLRAALIEGEESGFSEEFDVESFLGKMHEGRP
jgi:antitoxin ParD1/3/4